MEFNGDLEKSCFQWNRAGERLFRVSTRGSLRMQVWTTLLSISFYHRGRKIRKLLTSDLIRLLKLTKTRKA